jgi:hypothetical protein
MNDSYAIFESQLNDACNSFQNLRVKSIDGKCYLKGTLDILNTDNILVGSFLIEVRWSEGFPYRFPALFEVGIEYLKQIMRICHGFDFLVSVLCRVEDKDHFQNYHYL